MNAHHNHIQVAYLSFATRNMRVNCDREIQGILEKARDHNAKKNITGQLVYRSGTFLQLIEGDKHEVISLLGRILLDSSRHENIKVLLNQPMKERIFPDWSMAFKDLDNAALDIVECIAPWQKLMSFSEQEKIVNNDDILKIFEQLAA